MVGRRSRQQAIKANYLGTRGQAHWLARRQVRNEEHGNGAGSHHVRGRHRTVGRMCLVGWRVDDLALCPTLRVVGFHNRENPHLANPPDVVLLHVPVFEDAQREELRALVIVTEQAELDAARASYHAARVDGDLRIHLKVLVQLAVLYPRRADEFERAANVGGTVIDPDAADFERAVGGKEVGDVVPHLLVHVKAVGILQVPDFVFSIQRRDALFEGGERRRRIRFGIGLGIDGHRSRGGQVRDGNSGLIGRVVVRDEFQILCSVAPASLVRSRENWVVNQVGNFPHAALAHVSFS